MPLFGTFLALKQELGIIDLTTKNPMEENLQMLTIDTEIQKDEVKPNDESNNSELVINNNQNENSNSLENINIKIIKKD